MLRKLTAARPPGPVSLVTADTGTYRPETALLVGASPEAPVLRWQQQRRRGRQNGTGRRKTARNWNWRLNDDRRPPAEKGCAYRQ